MGFKEIGDVGLVVLGGLNKKTGKKNPTQLEGYFLRTETRADRKYGKGLQPYYIFLTKDGEVGVHGKTHLNRRMQRAIPGLMTLVTATDEVLDTGKGNPMKLFKVAQDVENSIDLTAEQSTLSDPSNYEEVEEESYGATEEDEPAPAPAARPQVAASSNKAKLQDLMNRARK